MKGKSKLYSIFKKKCPHCHEGDFFESNNPYNLKKAGNTLHECPVCHRKYSLEPGFYYGAMYVAYALGVALFVAIFVAIYVLFPSSDYMVYIGAITGGTVIAGPYLYALSKIIWANMFMSYKGVERNEREIRKEEERKRRRAEKPENQPA